VLRTAPMRWISTLLGLAGLMLFTGVALASDRFTDLRQIEPVHGDAAAGQKKATICFACHGPSGAPVAPMFPRLAGQRAEYLYHRLQSFRYADPKDPYYSKSAMTPNAVKLTDTDMRDLAAFFASQTPTLPPIPAGPGSPSGESLFRNGDPSRGIPPCQGCHGAEATGPASQTGQYTAYPALRGQSAAYLTARLTSYREGLPADTSNAFIMANVARTLDADSIQAIVAWLASLSPVRNTL
jgi:cytochrome c553